MSHATGTATDHADLLAKLIAFLTTDADLVTAGQEWTQVWNNADSSEIVLKGPGLDGTAAVYIGISHAFNTSADTYRIMFHGMADIVPTATAMSGHINVSSYSVGIYADSNPQQYWFIANGRRFIVVNKISTVYETAYCGLFLPYALPTTYPYPLLIGGSRNQSVIGDQSWRSSSGSHVGLGWPGQGRSLVDVPSDTPNMLMLDPTGVWVPVVNFGNVSYRHASLLPISGGNTSLLGFNMPNPDQQDDQFLGYRACLNIMRPALDGSYILVPLTLAIAPTYAAIPPFENEMLGVLDGAYWTQGFGNAAENTVDDGALTHLVVQNVFRTGNTDYIAVALG